MDRNDLRDAQCHYLPMIPYKPLIKSSNNAAPAAIHSDIAWLAATRRHHPDEREVQRSPIRFIKEDIEGRFVKLVDVDADSFQFA